MNNKRIIGLDILRILSMFGIIGLHVINQGGLISNLNIYTLNYKITTLLLIIFYTSVDIFGMLSGYLNAKKEQTKSKRILELIFILIFWGIVIPIAFYGFNIKNIRATEIKQTIQNIFPILCGRYWYITCYIFVFFMMPYINKLCLNLNKEEFKKLLILLFILLSLIPCIFLNLDLFKILNGYSPFWLIYCYMIGAYLRLYEIKISTKKIISILLLLLLVTFTVRILDRLIESKFSLNIIKEDWFINYISPTTLCTSMLFVLLFSKLDIKNNIAKNIIIYLSSASFSVYIIHCHKIIFDYIFKDLFVWMINWNFILLFLGIIFAIIAIYLICCILDEVRKILFRILKMEKLTELLGEKFDKFLI